MQLTSHNSAGVGQSPERSFFSSPKRVGFVIFKSRHNAPAEARMRSHVKQSRKNLGTEDLLGFRLWADAVTLATLYASEKKADALLFFCVPLALS